MGEYKIMSKDDNRYSDDYNAANEALIKRESQKFERAKMRAESLEKNMAKGIAAALREQRSNVASEAGKAVARSESGQLSSNERAMLDAAQKGIDNVRIDEGVITGFDLPEFLRGRGDDDE